MSRYRAFQPSEIEIGRPDEASEALAMARKLERYNDAAVPAWTPALTEQVMAAVDDEPAPAPVGVALAAVRGGRVSFAAFRDVWRVAWSGGRPLSVRASAIALVAVLLLALGSVGGATAVAAWNAINPHQAPIVVPSPSPALHTPAPSLSPPTTPSPNPVPSQSHPGSGASQTPMRGGSTPYPWDTHMPMQTHHPESSWHPGQTSWPWDGHH